MLTLFPGLLDYSLLAGLIVRVVASLYFAMLALRFIGTLRSIHDHPLGVRVFGYCFIACESIVSILLLVGLYTQGAALGGIVLTITSLALGIGRGSHPSERHVQILLLVLCVTLLFLGAGPFAFDLPL